MLLLSLSVLLLLFRPRVYCTSIAFCSDPGCMVINSTYQAIPDIGVRLATKGDSRVEQAWLLPGLYKIDTPELSGIENVLEPFFDDPQIHQGQGFDIEIGKDSISVFVSRDVSLLAYGGDNFQGASDNNEKKLKSYILRTDVAAIVDVDGAGVDTLQLWDGMPSSTFFGMGNATLTLSKLVRASDIKNNSDLCPRGEFKDGSKCAKCHETCATCWKGTSNTCLSCTLDKRLYNGACYPNFCAGGAFQISGLGLCLEDLLFLNLDVTGSDSLSKDKATGIDLKTVLPAVGGGILFLGFLAALFFYRRRSSRNIRSLMRENLTSWTYKQRMDSTASGTKHSAQDYENYSKESQFPQMYANPHYYELNVYQSPPRSLRAPTSTSSTSYSQSAYSVPPYSEGGPTVHDDWDSRQLALQQRIDKELTRRRLEIKAVAALERKRARESPHMLKDRYQPTLIGTDTSAGEGEELMTPRTLAKSIPVMPITERMSTPSIVLPKSVPWLEKRSHRKDPSIEKIDSWRKRNTRPDPVPPAETIASAAPLQTPVTPRSTGTKIERINEWVKIPKDSPSVPETIAEAPRHSCDHHSRKPSQESGRRSKAYNSRKLSADALEFSRHHERKPSRELPPPPSESDGGLSDALTSISRNAAKQTTLKAQREQTLDRAKQGRGTEGGPSSVGPTGINSVAQVLVDSMSELIGQESASIALKSRNE